MTSTAIHSVGLPMFGLMAWTLVATGSVHALLAAKRQLMLGVQAPAFRSVLELLLKGD